MYIHICHNMVGKYQLFPVCLLFILLLNKVSAQCSGTTLQININYTGFITSPGYDPSNPSSGTYLPNQNCSWHIEGTLNGINYQYTYTNIEDPDSVSIYDGCDDSDTLSNVGHTNGDGGGRPFTNTTSGSLFVQFTSDSTVQGNGFSIGLLTGFETNVGTACSVGQNLSSSSTVQYITSPGYPGKYILNMDCYWYIHGENGKQVQLDIHFVEMEGYQFDYLDIKDDQNNLVAKYYNSKSWNKITHTNESFALHFHSDNDVAEQGFVISFISVETPTTAEQTTTTVPETTTSTTVPETTTSTVCTYPIEWQTNTVEDSVEGTLNFTSNTLSGWSETSHGTSFSEWDCYQKIGNVYISRSRTLIDDSGDDAYAYLCMQVDRVNDNLYNYKLLSATESNSFQSRLVIIYATVTPNFVADCNEENHNETRTLTVGDVTTMETTTTTMETTTTTATESTTTAVCTYPTEWQTNTVNDSIEGTLIFTTTTLSGWSENSHGTTYSVWECYQKIGNVYISRSQAVIDDAGDDAYAYMCMQVEKVNANMYNYKLLSPKDSNSFNSRLVIIHKTVTPNFLADCNEEEHNDTRTLNVGDITTTTAVETTTTTMDKTTTAIDTTTTSMEITTTTSAVETTSTAVCTYPTEWQTSTVEDSVEGILIFTSTTLSGWSENSHGTTYSVWDCYQKIGNVYISRSQAVIDDAGDDAYAYMCMQVDKVNDNLYNYKLLSPMDSNSFQSRIVIIHKTITPNFLADCNEESHNETRTITVAEVTTSMDTTTTTATETTTTVPMETTTTTMVVTTTTLETTTTTPMETTTSTSIETTTTPMETTTSTPIETTTTPIETTTTPIGTTTTPIDTTTTALETTTTAEVTTTESQTTTTHPVTTTEQQTTTTTQDPATTTSQGVTTTTTQDTTTTTEQEVVTLSSASQIGITAGVIGGLSVLFLVGALVVVIIFSCCRKPKKKVSKSRRIQHDFEEMDDNNQSETTPSWVTMMDTLYESGYSPYFYNDFRSGKLSGESLNKV